MRRPCPHKASSAMSTYAPGRAKACCLAASDAACAAAVHAVDTCVHGDRAPPAALVWAADQVWARRASVCPALRVKISAALRGKYKMFGAKTAFGAQISIFGAYHRRHHARRAGLQDADVVRHRGPLLVAATRQACASPSQPRQSSYAACLPGALQQLWPPRTRGANCVHSSAPQQGGSLSTPQCSQWIWNVA